MPNRLEKESSPYLLQHANNPVDWYAWNEEALRAAREQDKPIFLSIGYSACHWCHVMEHESFENEALARMMNELFVCIKVDREERPDLDQIYMNAVQLQTGRGGWPMSVFLTPALQPFHTGTYWPPEPKMGMPGFGQVLQAVAEAWQNRRDEAVALAQNLTEHLQQLGESSSAAPKVDETFLANCGRQLESASDPQFGGFGRAPKFPHSMCLRLALRIWQRTGQDSQLNMVRLDLDKMAQGGIYDHLGGGFARYSVDRQWLVPHFEKMLYDNALLTLAYVEGFQATGDPLYERVVRETCDYVLRDMTDAEGGFHSTEDADSEGEEGKFYVWTPAEIGDLLGPEKAKRFCQVYDVSEEGNFEGKNILNLRRPLDVEAKLHDWDLDDITQELQDGRQVLFESRNQRVRPGKDDKVLTSWNGLMIEALARAAAVLDQSEYVSAAQRAANFVLQELQRDDGRLLHSWRQGTAKLDAYLDDYTYLIQSLTALYEADFDPRWLDEAVRLADIVLEHFQDKQHGGFYFTADDHEQLIARNKDTQDSSVPSGNGMAATALLRLARLCGRDDYEQAASGAFAAGSEVIHQSPIAAGQLLLAADFQLGPTYELVFVAETQDELAAGVAELKSVFLPNHVRSAHVGKGTPSQHLRGLYDGKPASSAVTLYACRQFACDAPAVGVDAVGDKLRAIASS